MFPFLRKATLPISTFESLFDFDERRLREGSGAPLLDALIRRLTGGWRFDPHSPSRLESLPETQAILNSDAKTRGDIFARLCLIVSYPDQNRTIRIQAAADRMALECLKKLLARYREMSLPSREAFAILIHDHRVQTNGYIGSYESGSFGALVSDAPKLLEMVVNAREAKVDADLAKLLGATLQQILDRRPLAAMPLALLALDCLGQRPTDFEPAHCYLEGEKATREWLESWQDVVHPVLWDYLESAAAPRGANYNERLRETAARVAPLSADERGEILAQMRRVAQDVVRRPTSAPWTFEDFLNVGRNFAAVKFRSYFDDSFKLLWEAVVTRSCRFSPDQALDLLTTLSSMRWPRHLAFGKSVAEALPRTEEARKAVERFASGVETFGLAAADRRNLQKQAALLCAAGNADATKAETLDLRYAKAAADFEAAFDAAMAATLAESKQIKSYPREVTALLQALDVMGGRNKDPFLQGPQKRRELLCLFGAVVKAGPAPESCLRKFAKIEETLEIARRARRVDISRGSPELRTRAPWLYEDYLGVDHTRAFIEIFKSLSHAGREAWFALEAFATTSPDTAKPSGAWTKSAQALALSLDAAARSLLFALMDMSYFVAAGPGDLKPLLGHNQTVKRAFVWLCASLPASEVVRPLTGLALRALAPHPQGGITNEILGNACLWSLSQLGAARVCRHWRGSAHAFAIPRFGSV